MSLWAFWALKPNSFQFIEQASLKHYKKRKNIDLPKYHESKNPTSKYGNEHHDNVTHVATWQSCASKSRQACQHHWSAQKYQQPGAVSFNKAMLMLFSLVQISHASDRLIMNKKHLCPQATMLNIFEGGLNIIKRKSKTKTCIITMIITWALTKIDLKVISENNSGKEIDRVPAWAERRSGINLQRQQHSYQAKKLHHSSHVFISISHWHQFNWGEMQLTDRLNFLINPQKH